MPTRARSDAPPVALIQPRKSLWMCIMFTLRSVLALRPHLSPPRAVRTALFNRRIRKPGFHVNQEKILARRAVRPIPGTARNLLRGNCRVATTPSPRSPLPSDRKHECPRLSIKILAIRTTDLIVISPVQQVCDRECTT